MMLCVLFLVQILHFGATTEEQTLSNILETMLKLFEMLNLNNTVISKKLQHIHEHYKQTIVDKNIESNIKINLTTEASFDNITFDINTNKINEENEIIKKPEVDINITSEESYEYIKEIVKRIYYLKIEDIFNAENKTIRNNTVIDSIDEEADLEYWDPKNNTEELWQTRRLYRGRRAHIRKYPFVVSVHVYQSSFCGGSIISRDLIITAASCLQLVYNNRLFKENPQTVLVRVGSNYNFAGGELIPVLELYFHPSYDPKTLNNNLVILRLNNLMHFNKFNRRIKRIMVDARATKLPSTTETVAVLGWGAINQRHTSGYFSPLRVSFLDVYQWNSCKEIYSNRYYLTSKNFCGGFYSRGAGACNRDLGDPGVVDGILMGVVSFGAQVCGQVDRPTVFTKLGYYAEWIQEIMRLPRITKMGYNRYVASSTKFSVSTPVWPTRNPKGRPFTTQPIINNSLWRTKNQSLESQMLRNVLRELLGSSSEKLSSGELSSDEESRRDERGSVLTRIDGSKSSASADKSYDHLWGLDDMESGELNERVPHFLEATNSAPRQPHREGLKSISNIDSYSESKETTKKSLRMAEDVDDTEVGITEDNESLGLSIAVDSAMLKGKDVLDSVIEDMMKEEKGNLANQLTDHTNKSLSTVFDNNIDELSDSVSHTNFNNYKIHKIKEISTPSFTTGKTKKPGSTSTLNNPENFDERKSVNNYRTTITSMFHGVKGVMHAHLSEELSNYYDSDEVRDIIEEKFKKEFQN